jgi:hypothetical protein
MRAFDDVDVFTDAGRESRWLAGDHPQRLSAVEQPVENLVADEAGGSSEDDHRSSFDPSIAMLSIVI